MLVSGLEVTPLQVDLIDRDFIRPYLGNSPKVVSRRMVQVKFDVELSGSGAAGTAPKWGQILMACGFAEGVAAGTSVTYSPVSSSFSSVSQREAL